jgi:polysaccharide export outer membrane protein
MIPKLLSIASVFCLLLSPNSATPQEVPATKPPQDQFPAYVLGPADVITLHAVDVEEISNKPIWIDTDGFINLPLVGRLKVGGMTIEEAESQLNDRLRTYVKDPHVVVAVTDFRSQPVSVLGMVGNPGVHQLQGRKTLLEILSQAGGMKPEAGATAKITRRIEYGEIPLPGATVDASGQFSIAPVRLKAITDGLSPEENILIRPHDVISVPKGEIVYVIGEVKKSGGFVLSDRKKTTVMEVLAMAEGMSPDANRKKAEILRLVSEQEERSKIVVNLDKIFAGKETDVALQAEDILVISTDAVKKITRKVSETAVTLAMRAAIWGLY